MDVKAAARSKRAQTQRAKSKHSTKHTQHSQEQKNKEPQHTQDHKKNEAQHSQEHKKKESQQGQSSHIQKVSQPKIAKPSPKEAQQGQSSHFQEDPQLQNSKPSQDLPTNWDRYEDPEGGEDVPPQLGSEPIKSKGADYAYLISQAQEQSGFDAVMPGYAEGITSMLYVRGQNLLSWGKDDNFIVKDDNASTEYEASFLSLDLHWLASQLTQLECSRRLLIEEDKLPAEMRASDSRAESHQLREQQHVHALENESRASAPSGKHEVGAAEDEVFSNENDSAVCDVQSMREYKRKDLKDTTGKSILSMEQVPLPKILGQGTVHSNKEVENHYLSSLDRPIKVGSSLHKADLQKNVEELSGIEAKKLYNSGVTNSKQLNLGAGNDIRSGSVRYEAAAAEAGSSLHKADLRKNVEELSGIEAKKLYNSGVTNSKQLNLGAGNDIRSGSVRYEAAATEVGSSLHKADLRKNVEELSGIEAKKLYNSGVTNSKQLNLGAGNDIRSGSVRFEAAAAEAELDALLDALDTPSNVGMLEVRETISDRTFTEKSLYKDKQPFQDQLQGPTNIISRDNHSLTLDDKHTEKANRAHQLDTATNRAHQVDTAKNTSGSKSTVATLLAPKLSTFKEPPKVVEDDFDAWLDTL